MQMPIFGGRTIPSDLTSASPGHLLYPQLSGYEAKLILIKPKFTLHLRV